MAHQRLPITVKLDSFEGPLDLLLHLIQAHEMDVSKVSISKVTDQYLQYIRVMNELDFNVASEFLVMAATLLVWKSRAILPKDEVELTEEEKEIMGPSPEELIKRLMEHQQFLAAGEQLAQIPRLHDDVFIREGSKPPVHRIWRDMNMSDLALSYQDCVVRSRKRKKVLKKETVSLGEKIMQLRGKIEIGKLTELKDLVSDTSQRPEWVVAFLASLELARLSKMNVFQNDVYDPIYVKLIASLDDLDKSVLIGFEQEIEKQIKKEQVPAELIAEQATPADNSTIGLTE